MTHRYILPGAAWEVPAQRGAVVGSIPFTHPAHVPALLELLRHQCAINTLLRTCVTFQRAGTGRTSQSWFTMDKITHAKLAGKIKKTTKNISLISCSLLSGSVCDLHYEVLPESETSFSVTFQRPDTDSLAVCKRSLQIITKIKLSLIRRSLRASTCEKPFRIYNNGLYSSNLV